MYSPSVCTERKCPTRAAASRAGTLKKGFVRHIPYSNLHLLLSPIYRSLLQASLAKNSICPSNNPVEFRLIQGSCYTLYFFCSFDRTPSPNTLENEFLSCVECILGMHFCINSTVA